MNKYGEKKKQTNKQRKIMDLGTLRLGMEMEPQGVRFGGKSVF